MFIYRALTWMRLSGIKCKSSTGPKDYYNFIGCIRIVFRLFYSSA